MQKKIIALAIAAAFSAPAFADTTVYGIVDAVAANIQASGTKSDMSIHSGGLAGSRLGVKSTEEIGTMKAGVVLEYSLDNTDAAGIGAARQEYVSLSGGYGELSAGYLQSTGFSFSRFDPTAGSLITPLGNITKTVFLVGNNASLKRLPRALGYMSPDMGGFTIGANYSTGADGATDLGVADGSTQAKSTAYLVSGNYAAGPFAAALVYANKTDAVAAAATVGAVKRTEYALGGSYDLGMAKLFATYQSNKVDTNNDSDTAYSVSASAPFGASTVVLTYASVSRGSTTAEDNSSGYTLAYLNSLSKTTTFYAAYSAQSQNDGTNAYSVGNDALAGAVAGGTGSNMIVAGLNKKF
jgi:predicted porin